MVEVGRVLGGLGRVLALLLFTACLASPMWADEVTYTEEEKLHLLSAGFGEYPCDPHGYARAKETLLTQIRGGTTLFFTDVRKDATTVTTMVRGFNAAEREQMIKDLLEDRLSSGTIRILREQLGIDKWRPFRSNVLAILAEFRVILPSDMDRIPGIEDDYLKRIVLSRFLGTVGLPEESEAKFYALVSERARAAFTPPKLPFTYESALDWKWLPIGLVQIAKRVDPKARGDLLDAALGFYVFWGDAHVHNPAMGGIFKEWTLEMDLAGLRYLVLHCLPPDALNAYPRVLEQTPQLLRRRWSSQGGIHAARKDEFAAPVIDYIETLEEERARVSADVPAVFARLLKDVGDLEREVQDAKPAEGAEPTDSPGWILDQLAEIRQALEPRVATGAR